MITREAHARLKAELDGQVSFDHQAASFIPADSVAGLAKQGAQSLGTAAEQALELPRFMIERRTDRAGVMRERLIDLARPCRQILRQFATALIEIRRDQVKPADDMLPSPHGGTVSKLPLPGNAEAWAANHGSPLQPGSGVQVYAAIETRKLSPVIAALDELRSKLIEDSHLRPTAKRLLMERPADRNPEELCRATRWRYLPLSKNQSPAAKAA